MEALFLLALFFIIGFLGYACWREVKKVQVETVTQTETAEAKPKVKRVRSVSSKSEISEGETK